MSRNKAEQQSWSARTVVLAFCAATVLGLALAPQARAHGLLLSWGTVVVHPDRVQTRIEVGAEDFVHYYQLRAQHREFSVSAIREAVARHKQHILDHFIIRDQSGQRLRGTIVDVKWSIPSREMVGYSEIRNITIAYTLEHPTGSHPRFLTFQQHFGGVNTSMPVQLAVSITSAGSPVERFIRLTNRGNVETLQFAWPDSDGTLSVGETDQRDISLGDLIPDMGRNRFKSVNAFVYLGGVDVCCDVYIPFVLLETWLPVERANADFLESREISVAEEQIHAFFTHRIPSTINGEAVLPIVALVSFIGPDAATIDEAVPAQRLGAWSARVCVRLKYATHAPVTQMELDWNLFNSVVLNARVVTVFNDARAEHLVTTYNPKVACPFR